MRYYLDTEFIDDGKTIDLISIGIVAEDGREYYKQNIAFFGRAFYDSKETPQWIVENVFPHLSNNPWDWCDLSVMKAEISVFMDIEAYGKPELWGWCSGYDFVALCQIFGTMMDLPPGYPHYMRDIQQVLDERGIADDELPPPLGQAHNALDDAKYIQMLWDNLHPK